MMLENKKFLIWGATGQAKVLDEIIRLSHGQVIALVDIKMMGASPIKDVPVLHGKQGYTNWRNQFKKTNPEFEISAIAAIGGRRGRDRAEYLNTFRLDGFITPSLIHPKAHVSDTATIGDNCQISAFAFVGAEALVNDACIINTKASIDHETILGKGVHIAPGATLCGCIEVGNYSFIGAGAVILPNLKIGENSIVGAGSIVTKNVPDNVLVYGSPARVIREVKNA